MSGARITVYTPHIAVRVDNQTRVPRQFVRDNEIVLNISFDATSQLQMGNEWIEFSARFSGKAHKLEVPVANVLAIYARENGQGMAFPVDSTGGEAADSEAAEGSDAVEAGPPSAVAAPALTSAPRRPEPPGSVDADNTPPSGDDGAKGSGKGHLKVVK